MPPTRKRYDVSEHFGTPWPRAKENEGTGRRGTGWLQTRGAESSNGKRKREEKGRRRGKKRELSEMKIATSERNNGKKEKEDKRKAK